MYNMDFNIKPREPFLVPFSNIPYIFNGSNASLIRGASCFALFILESQGRKNELENTVDYIFTEDECSKEMSVTSSSTTEDRLIKTENFFDEHFKFLADIEFNDFTKLFVYTAFLDQLATDCYQYVKFNQPTTSNYIEAFKNIELLAEYKNVSIDKVKEYKNELLDLLSVEKPNAYFAILFNAT